jgi:DNA end-binding protein Ku
MPRPGRAYWKGILRLSLVSIPVEVCNAVDTSSEIHLNQIHKPSGKRINYTKTVKGVGPINSEDIIKGYEIDKEIYVTLEQHEIDALKVASKRTVDLQQFIDVEEIDPRYFEKPYYVVPADEHAAEGYVVIRDALRVMKKLGIGQITLSGREHIVAVGPVDDGLVMEVLRYKNEIKQPKAYFADLPSLKPDKEMIALAQELISRKSAPFEPERYKDTYATAMKELIDKKAKGQRIIVPPSYDAPEGKVINLMDALKGSLKAAAGAKPTPANDDAPKKKPAAKSSRSKTRAAS